jgi:hypothetical protein
MPNQKGKVGRLTGNLTALSNFRVAVIQESTADQIKRMPNLSCRCLLVAEKPANFLGPRGPSIRPSKALDSLPEAVH